MGAEATPIIVGKEIVSDDHYIVRDLFFKDGDPVNKGDVVGTFETSKGVIDVAAPAAGYVFYRVTADEEVAVGAVFAAIFPSPHCEEGCFERFQREARNAGVKELAGSGRTPEIRVSNAARQLAQQHGVELSVFQGKSLVRAADVLEYLQGSAPEGKVQGEAPSQIAGPGNRIILHGGGGHAKMCIDILRQTRSFQIAGIVDSGLRRGSQTMGVPVLGGDELFEELFQRGIWFAVVGFGALHNPVLREESYRRFKEIGFVLPNLIHPAAALEPSVRLGEGNQVMAGAIVGSDVRVGNNCILNSGSVVSHDCQLSDNVHLTPGALLAGGVHVGRNTIIGMGASVYLGVRIGDHVVVHNGARVLADVPDGAVVRA
jgi:sugar O-acyltransferase (sialic acid O-acetyltransferase NeuD family)